MLYFIIGIVIFVAAIALGCVLLNKGKKALGIVIIVIGSIAGVLTISLGSLMVNQGVYGPPPVSR